MEDWTLTNPSWVINGTNTTDVHSAVIRWRDKDYQAAINDGTYVDNAEVVVKFFQNLDRGSFIRYGKADVPSPSNGVHSIVFDKLLHDGTGIWVYEANQDGNCGVGYQMYTFTQIHKNYEHIMYYVERELASVLTYNNAERHAVGCVNCDGYLLQPHDDVTTQYLTINKHKISYHCCGGSVLEAHLDTTLSYICSQKGHIPSYDCCEADSTLLQAHEYSNGRCSVCGYIQPSILKIRKIVLPLDVE